MPKSLEKKYLILGLSSDIGLALGLHWKSRGGVVCGTFRTCRRVWSKLL